MTVDGTSVSVLSGGEVILDGTILIPGGAEMTIDGIRINVAFDGNLVVDGTTLKPEAAIPSTDDSPATTTTPDTNTTHKIPITTSNAGLGAPTKGPFEGKPIVPSISTGSSSTSEDRAARSVNKVSSLTIAMLSILMGLWIS